MILSHALVWIVEVHHASTIVNDLQIVVDVVVLKSSLHLHDLLLLDDELLGQLLVDTG